MNANDRDARSQGISSHATNLDLLEYSGISTRRVKYSPICCNTVNGLEIYVSSYTVMYTLTLYVLNFLEKT